MAIHAAAAEDVRRRMAREVLRATSTPRSGFAWWDVSELGIATAGFLLYFFVRAAVTGRTVEALANAHTIMEWERGLGIFVEPAIQRWVLDAHVRIETLNFVYFWFDFPLIVGVGLALFRWRRHEYTLLRDALLVSGIMALAVYYAFPVAPPRFFPDRGFVDTLAEFSQLSYQAQSMRPFVNAFAAVPSLHVGWAFLLAIEVFLATPSWAARGAAVVICLVQCFAVIGTGNHYFFDGVMGLGICAVALLPVAWLHCSGYPALRRQLGRWANDGRRERPAGQRMGVRSLADR